MKISRKALSGACGVFAFGMCSLAFAWDNHAQFGTTVHGHEFARVTAHAEDCTLRVQLFFRAPEKAYANDARGYYRFRARVKFKEGHSAITRVFGNRNPGSRVYTDRYDTSAEGCWAKGEQKFEGVDVEGCRGKVCRVRPFED